MDRNRDTVWCDGCGVEILWAPMVADERDYCCRDCSRGLACDCGEPMELEEERRNGEHESTRSS